MPTLTAPGVYVEEVSSGVKPIDAAGTSTAAFFGEAERGPIGQVVKIFNFTDYQTLYGDFPGGGRYLAHSVYQFFNNGGAACYVGRVAPGAAAASVTVLDRAGTPRDSLTFAAASPGVWGNRTMVTVDSAAATDPANQFNLAVWRDGDPEPVLLESFADLGMDPGAPNHAPGVVNGRSAYLRVLPNLASTSQMRGYSEGAEVQVDDEPLLGAAQRQLRVNLNGDGLRTVNLTAALDGADLADPEAVRAGIEQALRALAPLRDSTPAGTYSAATVTFTTTTAPDGVFRITAGGPPTASSRVVVQDAEVPQVNAAGALKLGVRNGGTEVSGAAEMRPRDTAPDDFYFLGDDTVEGAVSAVTPGSDGDTPQDADFLAALRQLDTIRDVSLVAIPGIGSTAVVDGAMAYCAGRPLSDCFFIGDMDLDDAGYTGAIGFRDGLNAPNSYGAVYFPWLYMLDPAGGSAPVAVPPSGFVAGLYGRIDARRGVWKAPAGTEAIVAGAVGLAASLTDVQHGDLNNHPKSVSVIRRFPAAGIVAWGARTVSSDPEYRYIPVRRTAIMLRVSIYNGIQWAVFEPNDASLWASLRLNIGTFMNGLFRRGAFQGATPAQAYFVKCDAETNPQGDIDLGIVNVLVGFAPLKPAEFVVVRIRQKVGQGG
jgi:phage tail sheath protein FI